MANDWQKAPPPGEGSYAARIAAELRAAQTELDEFSVARMERAMIQGWQARAAWVEPMRQGLRPRRGRSLFFAFSLLGATALGTLLGAYVLSENEPQLVVDQGAQFEMRLANGAVQRGLLAEGQVLESGRHGHVQVDIGRSRIEVDPLGRVRFDRISSDNLQVTVVEGRIEAQFNPEHQGDRHMSVETRSARVRVIGTRFSVSVDSQGNTKVEVTEGAVEVEPRHGSKRRLGAGQSTEVLYDPGDATEQAVRQALTEQLSASAAFRGMADPSLAPPAQPRGAAAAEAVRTASASGDARQGAAASGRGSEAASVTEGRQSVSPKKRLQQARELLRKGKHRAARRRLRKLSRDTRIEPQFRAEALTLTAESYTAQGYIPRATDAYRAAAATAPHHVSGHTAVFAMARLLERYTHDAGGARAAYRRYLRQAPHGALAGQARRALCRLGRQSYCTK